MMSINEREALDLAKQFHEAYERLAPQFGYETREATRQFDAGSTNGKLMIAVCAELQTRAELATAPAVAAPAVEAPAAWQFQDRDGVWCFFMNERHRQETIKDGTWPIRALYTATAASEQDARVQWWLATLNQYGNPTLTDGAHQERAGADKAAYLIDAMNLGRGKKYAVARVELSEPKPSSDGVNHDAIAMHNRSAQAAQQGGAA